MKILAINNYSLEECIKKSKKGLQPAHHNWGVDFLSSKGHDVKYMHIKSTGGIKCRINNIIKCLSNISYFNKFDAIIAFANPIIGFAAFLKQIGLIKCQLFTVVHHYHRFMELSNGYDKIFFLSKKIMELTKNKYPHLEKKMVYLEWGADLAFYEDTYQEIKRNMKEKRINLISNGKTDRDLELITKACDNLNLPLIIITDKAYIKSAISSGIKGKNAITYKDLLHYMSQCKISLIPIIPTRSKTSLCGLTSFLDACALGQPIIMSDNTNISIDIEKLGIGLYYKAGDEEDLLKKIDFVASNNDYLNKCGYNARLYAENHSYFEYCKKLESQLKDIKI